MWYRAPLSEPTKEDINFVEDAGAARRRRERRLRQWLRHERFTVAAALSEACHHTMSQSSRQKKVVEAEKHSAPRGGNEVRPAFGDRRQQRNRSLISSCRRSLRGMTLCFGVPVLQASADVVGVHALMPKQR